MRIARYQAVPLKINHRRSISTVNGRLREKSTVDSRLRKKKGRRRGNEKKKRKKEYLAHVPSSPAGRLRVVATCDRGRFFSRVRRRSVFLHGEKYRVD
ncbi:hypothetical protein B296_00028295, partial [Ensete ventricosum]